MSENPHIDKLVDGLKMEDLISRWGKEPCSMCGQKGVHNCPGPAEEICGWAKERHHWIFLRTVSMPHNGGTAIHQVGDASIGTLRESYGLDIFYCQKCLAKREVPA